MIFFVLFSLFVDKIRKHPDYAAVPPAIRAESKETLRAALEKAEELRPQVDRVLRARFQRQREFQMQSMVEQEKRQRAEEERRRAEDERRRRERESIDAKLLALAAARERDFEARKQKRAEQEAQNNDLSGSNHHHHHMEKNSLIPAADRDNFSFSNDLAADNVHRRLDPDDGRLFTPNVVAAARPTVDRATKPAYLSSGESPSTNDYGLRTVMVPESIVHRFLELADSNTRRNVETCAILSGSLVRSSAVLQ